MHIRSIQPSFYKFFYYPQPLLPALLRMELAADDVAGADHGRKRESTIDGGCEHVRRVGRLEDVLVDEVHLCAAAQPLKRGAGPSCRSKTCVGG